LSLLLPFFHLSRFPFVGLHRDAIRIGDFQRVGSIDI
jgi:hypothetical protein